MNFINQLKISIVIALVTAQFCCNLNKDHYNWDGGAITEFGTYYLKNSKYIIFVFQEEALLKYKMFSNDSTILIESKEKASVYQGWFLFWDNKTSRLWVQSSDIGIFVWSHEMSTNGFKEIVITPDEKIMIKNIPDSFYNLLPELDKGFCKKNGYSP